MRRYGFVTRRRKHHAIPRNISRMHLDHIADHFSRCQNQVHSVMSLCAAVADIRHVKMSRLSSLFINSVCHLLTDLVQMDTARMAVPKHILDQYLRLFDVLLIPSAPQLQGIKLRPQKALLTAAYHIKPSQSVLFPDTFIIAKSCRFFHLFPE